MDSVCPRCGGAWAKVRVDGHIMFQLCRDCLMDWESSSERRAVHEALRDFLGVGLDNGASKEHNPRR